MYFLTDRMNVSDFVDSSNGYMGSDWAKEICESLIKCENLIEKVVWQESIAILEMPFYGRKAEAV